MKVKRVMFLVVLSLLLVGMMGTIAYASDLDWTTTDRWMDYDYLYVEGYFTNNRSDRVIDRIDWFQSTLIFTTCEGKYYQITQVDKNPQECWIDNANNYTMVFKFEAPGDTLEDWRMSNNKWNYHWQDVKD